MCLDYHSTSIIFHDLCHKFHVLAFNSYTTTVNSTLIGFFKYTAQSSLRSLLKGEGCIAGTFHIAFELRRNLHNQAGEGCLLNHEVSCLLKAANLLEGNCSRTVSVGFFYTCCRRC